MRTSWIHIGLALTLAMAALLFVHLHNAGGLFGGDPVAPVVRSAQ